MNTKQAVAKRIVDLCNQYETTVHALAITSGVPPMTVYSMLNQKSQNPGVVTVKKLCDGLGITLVDFFNTKEFLELEQEIK